MCYSFTLRHSFKSIKRVPIFVSSVHFMSVFLFIFASLDESISLLLFNNFGHVIKYSDYTKWVHFHLFLRIL